jgi:hypothetical protein
MGWTDSKIISDLKKTAQEARLPLGLEAVPSFLGGLFCI